MAAFQSASVPDISGLSYSPYIMSSASEVPDASLDADAASLGGVDVARDYFGHGGMTIVDPDAPFFYEYTPDDPDDADDLRPTYNVFVADLSKAVTEDDLRLVFGTCGELQSVSVVRDKATGASKGFGFVNYLTLQGQLRCLQEFREVKLKDRVARTFPSECKTRTLHVGNLPRLVSSEIMRAAIEARTGPVENFVMKTGFCFVTYVNHKQAIKALQRLRNWSYDGKRVKAQVAHGKDRSRDATPCTLYVRGIAPEVSETQLADVFSAHGTVSKVTIVRHPETRENRGFAFVELTNWSAASSAVKTLDGVPFMGHRLIVQFAKPTKDPMMMTGPGGRSLPLPLSPTGSSVPAPGSPPLVAWDEARQQYVIMPQSQPQPQSHHSHGHGHRQHPHPHALPQGPLLTSYGSRPDAPLLPVGSSSRYHTGARVSSRHSASPPLAPAPAPAPAGYPGHAHAHAHPQAYGSRYPAVHSPAPAPSAGSYAHYQQDRHQHAPAYSHGGYGLAPPSADELDLPDADDPTAGLAQPLPLALPLRLQTAPGTGNGSALPASASAPEGLGHASHGHSPSATAAAAPFPELYGHAAGSASPAPYSSRTSGGSPASAASRSASASPTPSLPHSTCASLQHSLAGSPASDNESGLGSQGPSWAAPVLPPASASAPPSLGWPSVAPSQAASLAGRR